MKIIHHFGLNISQEKDAQAFAAAGIKLDRGPANLPGSRIASFEIAEDHPSWSEAQHLAEKFKITDFVRTEFSDLELGSAQVLCMIATGNKSFPEPSENRGYLDATYDLSEYCVRCGTGLRQVRPFQIGLTSNPNRTILQLNWIFDEFFVDQEVWAAVFEPFDIKTWPVLSSKTGEILDSIVQLRISQRSHMRLVIEKLTICSDCGRSKFPIEFRRFAPSPVDIPAPIFKSIECFGPDANSINRVFVSSSVFKEIRRARLRGVSFYPCL